MNLPLSLPSNPQSSLSAGWTDAHLHPLDLADLPAALERSILLGVTRWVANSTHPEEWSALATLSGQVSQIRPQFGVHPWRAGDLPDDWAAQLTEQLLRFPQAGVGEIGLDSKLTETPLDVQRAVFVEQVRIANRFQRSCTVHVVGAWAELAETLRIVRPDRMLLHAYSGGPERLAEFLPHAVWVSFGGAVIRQHNSSKLQEAVRRVPTDRLLLETDAPYQHPEGKDFDQEPAGLLRIAEAVAKIRGVPVDELRRQTERNVEAFGSVD